MANFVLTKDQDTGECVFKPYPIVESADGSVIVTTSFNGDNQVFDLSVPPSQEDTNTFVTGFALNETDNTLTIFQNDGSQFSVNLTDLVMGPDLPRGLQIYTDEVVGAFETSLAASNQSARIKAGRVIENPTENPNNQYYEILPPNPVTISATDFEGLAVAGTDITAEIQTNVGYWWDTIVNEEMGGGHLQFGAAIFIDGQYIQSTRDDYFVNQSGYNSFLSDLQSVEFQTTGNDIVIEVVPYIRANTDSANFSELNTIKTDMAQIGVRYDAF